MLDEAEKKGHSRIVAWCPNGQSFKISDPAAMVPILAIYFRQTKYKSLLRQLQGYSFKRVTRGEQKGVVSHPEFMRGRRSLCTQMKRKQAKPTKINSVTTNSNSNTKNNSNKNKAQSCSSSTSQTSSKNISIVRDIAAGRDQQQKQQQATGLDALRVEIGCTFSSSSTNNKNGGGSKRNAPPPQQQHYVVQGSLSAPTLVHSAGHISKRQRSHANLQQHNSHNASTYIKNASFSSPLFMMQQSHRAEKLQQQLQQQSQDKAILTEEKMQFLKNQQNQKQFEQLEKLCFFNHTTNNNTQARSEQSGPGLPQQFQHCQQSSSTLGTLDVDISLTTTTTTTTTHGPQVSSSKVCNKILFVLPTQCEPTPMQSPIHQQNPKGGISSLIMNPSLNCLVEKTNTNTNVFSDDIDEGIAQAFDGSGNGDVDAGDTDNNRWPLPPSQVTFESDFEDDRDDDNVDDDWTKGIVYEGNADCVLEPELFQYQLEVQEFRSPKQLQLQVQVQQQHQSPHQQQVQVQAATAQQQYHQHFMQQQQQQMMMQQQQLQLQQHPTMGRSGPYSANCGTPSSVIPMQQMPFPRYHLPKPITQLVR